MHALFLSYSREDADAVRDVRARLEARGVRTFVDWHDLTPGLPWPDALERALRDSRAVAVFVGRSGFGVWQQREMHYALYLQAQSEFSLPVVPVILRGADPPAGFLILNTWLDLRAGISDAAIEPLIRTLEGVAPPASPAVDICPYRDLRAFREEDSALFFGRDEVIDAIVAKLDRAKFVAVVGPSGSGKSSVVTAGVVPRLRSRRPPQPVWDHIVFTPGDDPWRRFADALLPLLDASLSEVQRLRESRELADELRNGIAPAIERVVQKSGGSDRLLVVADQFEELLTLTDSSVATGFVRALFDASGRAPMTVLITLRGDYYGKAIQLDRDFSKALPDAQVNLGPMRRDELREIVTRPASIAGLEFEPGLVDRILEDVGDEPGNLPLLEYALSELWSLRLERSLKFAAYQEIGGVTGALTKRANAAYAPLSPSEKLAARRLMTRLVRVSAEDEEGADTRRRAHRDEIDDDAWKLVDRFVQARLLVAGDDETVEVAHESLIRKWDRLREWLNEDRKFLLWRQQLAIYRAAFADTPLQGNTLKEAQKWLRTRRAELSADERALIETSTRSRRRWTIVVAAVALIVIVAFGVTRTAPYNVQTILRKDPEAQLFGDSYIDAKNEQAVKDLALLMRMGREKEIREEIVSGTPRPRALKLARFALAMHAVDKPRVPALLQEAESVARQTPENERMKAFVEIARVWIATGNPEAAAPLLEEAERASRMDVPFRRAVAEAWRVAGKPESSRRTILTILPRDQYLSPELTIARLAVAETLIRLKVAPDRRTVEQIQLVTFMPDPPDGVAIGLVFVVRAYLATGNLESARSFAKKFPSGFYRDQALEEVAVASAKGGDFFGAYSFLRTTPVSSETVKESLIDEVMALFARKKLRAEAEQMIAAAPKPMRNQARGLYVKHLLDAGWVKEGNAEANKIRHVTGDVNETFTLTHARLAEAFARTGERDHAEKAIRFATSQLGSLTESRRDEVHAILATAHAHLGNFRDARLLADEIEDDATQWQAYFSILRVYEEKNRT